MTKEDLIARLKSLGAQLGRDVSLTGSKEELALRVAELEEELDEDPQEDGWAGAAGPEGGSPGVNLVNTAQEERVAVKTLRRMHLDCPLAMAGAVTHVSSAVAESLLRRGLVRKY